MKNNTTKAISELTESVYAALETYSNVHRGSGHKSAVSTYLYEQAREIVLQYLGLDKSRYVVIFCSPARAEVLTTQTNPDNYSLISDRDTGLSLGIRALAVKKKALPRGVPFQTGGGTTRLVSPDWVLWADAPERFEAGTPAIINAIMLARALQLTVKYGQDVFRNIAQETCTVADILYRDDLEEYRGKELLDKLRLMQIGRGLPVPTAEGTRPYINLDNAASTPAFIPVWETFCHALLLYRKINKEIISEAKSVCGSFLGAPAEEYDVLFTSNTTESINIIAENLGRITNPEPGSLVLNTVLEHNSNDLPWRKIRGISVLRMGIDSNGIVDLDILTRILKEHNDNKTVGGKHIKLIAICGASNVLGIFNNLEEICRIAHLYGAQVLVDAAQLVAHRKIDMNKCGIDYLVFSAHKVYAPFGCGVLVARKSLTGFSSEDIEQISSSGEENVGGIAALAKSLVLLQRVGLDLIQAEEHVLTGRLLEGLARIDGMTIYGIKNTSSSEFLLKGGVIVFNLKNIFANTIARELAGKAGIGIRYGCHCAHILIKQLVGVGPFLDKFQRIIASLFPLNFPGLARVSLGIENDKEDVDRLILALTRLSQKYEWPETDMQKQMSGFISAAAQKVYSG